MDDQPGTDILGQSNGWQRPAVGPLVLIAGLLLAAGCPRNAASPPPDLPAVGGQVSLLRVPRGGGTVEAYRPDSLGEPIWTTRVDVPPIREIVGVNNESWRLMVVDTLENLVAIDLESRGIRTVGPGAAQAVMAPDGTVVIVTSARKVIRFEGGLPVSYKAALPLAPIFQAGTLGERYVAVLNTKPRRLVIMNPDRQLHATEVADGAPAATYWGELVAIGGTGSELTLIQTAEPFAARTLDVGGPARQVLFSPSGHRLYVSHDGRRVEAFDRFSLARVGTIDLPGTPGRLRTDGSGRWLLAQPAGADSVWVVDLATGKLTATVATRWGDDLPTVAGGAILVARQAGDVVSLDMARAGAEVGRVAGGSVDHWIVTQWLPTERLSRAAVVAESALVAQDSALAPDSLTVPAADRLYLQISSSQNADWSREFAKQLNDAGYPARVLDPGTPDEGYRVVVGPFGTREAAEETGRKLARPYFILTNPPIKQ